MKDERGGNARPNRKGCTLPPIGPSPASDQHQSSHHGQFESVYDHALNMSPESPIDHPSRSPQ